MGTSSPRFKSPPRCPLSRRHLLLLNQPFELRLVDYLNAQLVRLVELAAGFIAGQDVVGLFADAATGAPAVLLDDLLNRLAGVILERAGDDDGFAGERQRSDGLWLDDLHLGVDTRGLQVGDRFLSRFAAEKVVDRGGDCRANFMDLTE